MFYMKTGDELFKVALLQRGKKGKFVDFFGGCVHFFSISRPDFEVRLRLYYFWSPAASFPNNLTQP